MMNWMLAFLIHSTLWCGCAWVMIRVLPPLHARTREMLWGLALTASLLTPTAQLFLAPDTALWRVSIPTMQEAAMEQEHSTEVSREHRNESIAQTAAPWSSIGGVLEHVERSGILLTWFGVAGFLTILYGARLAILHRRIGDRTPIDNPRACSALARLAQQANLTPAPRLTESNVLGSPIAFGCVQRKEICLPARAVHTLDDDELAAMLGHELAHHVHGDTYKLIILNILQAVFFFQPMFRIAARAIRNSEEEQCDDWAANTLRDRLAMASCLAEVAGWITRRDGRLPVPRMAQRKSLLRTRIERLMNEPRHGAPAHRVWRVLSVVIVLSLAPWVAPTVAAPTDDNSGWSEHEHANSLEHRERSEHSEHRDGD